MNDLILNVVIGLVTGLISGVISGVIVSIYFKKKDTVQEAERELSRQKQDLSTYLTAIRIDLEKLYDDLKRGESGEVYELRKALNSVPKFTVYQVYFKNAPEDAKKPTVKIYKLITDLDAYLQVNELKPIQILKYRAGLFTAQFDMLKDLNYRTLMNK